MLRCRQVVVEALSDMEARFPGPSPPVLSAKVLFFDGREGESMYPNLMLASEQVRCGLV